MVRNLSEHVVEAEIAAKLTECGLLPKDIRLMRRKDTGVSRGFAFVEFQSLTEAIRWKDITQGCIQLESCQATLHYSVPKDALPLSSIQKYDWTCYKCGVNNFKRRDQCFKCGTGREESAANDTGDEVSPTPTNSLLFRNLSTETTEERILTLFGSLTALPIKAIRIPTDPVYHRPRGVCIIELNSTIEATQLFTLLNALHNGLIIDQSQVTISYAKRSGVAGQINASAVNAASVALAAAQWTNQSAIVDTKPAVAASNFATVMVNGVNYQKFPPPDTTKYQLDPSSGYYFDATTNLYYEPKSKYYYNSITQQYLFWSPEHSTYLPVPSDNKSTAAATSVDKDNSLTSDSKTPKDDKVKTAKKIAKDMEKWAKTLNQRTQKATQSIMQPISSNPVDEPNETEDAQTELSSTSVNSQRISLSFNKVDKVQELLSQFVTDDVDAEDNVDLDALVKAEESSLIDWDKNLCLVCKRQLNNKEMLEKHIEQSKLHKTTLMEHLRTKLTEEQFDWLQNRKSGDSYRDRAKERRKKYGQPAAEADNFKAKFMKELGSIPTQVTSAPVKRISSDNKGSRMLPKMGWTEGQGLGRSNQGRQDIVHHKSEGLGYKSKTQALPGETYKDAVKRAMAQRYKELSDQ